MRCTIKEYHPSTSDAISYHLNVVFSPESPSEAMELGIMSMSLRREEVWCVIHKESAQLEVMVKK